MKEKKETKRNNEGGIRIEEGEERECLVKKKKRVAEEKRLKEKERGEEKGRI